MLSTAWPKSVSRSTCSAVFAERSRIDWRSVPTTRSSHDRAATSPRWSRLASPSHTVPIGLSGRPAGRAGDARDR